ncbi:tRNA-dihydrouridine synthase family protein [Candidatus Woesearchaeota archaeon]|nr:tRNA-dihydrouridine synthase family protein [Candidatus Woesearchaeota archaeon]
MKDFEFMLAPMEDYTDNAFRELCFNHGADLTFTEMTRLTGLIRNNKSTERRIEILNNVPTQIQLAAKNEDHLKLFLKKFKPTEGFQGINFNLGCPSPHLIKIGLGCALMKRISKVNRLVQIVKNNGFSCSIKMRLGLNQYEKEKFVYLNLLKNVDADFFIIHARHGKEDYESKADDKIYPECVDTGKTIIANGDIDSVEKVNYMKKLGVKGVMIGRAAVCNPSIFEQLKGHTSTDIKTLKSEYVSLIKKYPHINNKYYVNIMKRIGSTQNAFPEQVMG